MWIEYGVGWGSSDGSDEADGSRIVGSESTGWVRRKISTFILKTRQRDRSSSIRNHVWPLKPDHPHPGTRSETPKERRTGLDRGRGTRRAARRVTGRADVRGADRAGRGGGETLAVLAKANANASETMRVKRVRVETMLEWNF